MSDDRVATTYFNDVGKKKQPTAAEERELFGSLSRARDAKEKVDKLAHAKEAEIRRKAKRGVTHEKAKSLLVELQARSKKLDKRIAELEGQAAEGYVRFVIKQARRYTRDPQTLRDLIGEGNGGLMVAVKAFNVHLGWRFLTYAVYWIEVRIQEYLNREGVVHVPNHAKKASRKLRKHEEVEMTRGARSQHSFEEPTHAGIDTELLAAPDKEDNHEGGILKHMLDAGLDVEQRLVLVNTFGLRDTTPMDLDELSDYFFALNGSVKTPDSLKDMKETATNLLRAHFLSHGVASAAAFL